MSYQPFPAFADWGVQFDPAAVDAYAERLRQVKASATAEAQRQALEIATRSAAVDTGALEGLYTTDRGFTRTIATQSEFWQEALAARDAQVARSIQDALDAYEFVLDATTARIPVTAAWIRQLHATVTAHQETYTVYVPVAGQLHEEERPLPRGEYKRYPNNPTSRRTGETHDYAPVDDTAAEVNRLVDELRSPAFEAAHSVVQAAYAHYAYVAIHPFADGNGRVARALASIYLYRDPGVPLVIFADQRNPYIDSLELADAGRPDAFVQFLTQRVIDTVNMVSDSLEPDEDDDSADLAGIAEATRGWLSEDRVRVAQRLQSRCIARLQEELNSKNALGVLDVRVNNIMVERRAGLDIPPGYSVIGPSARFSASAVVDQATGRRVYATYAVAATNEDGRAEFLVVPEIGGGMSFEVWRREIDPAETESFRLRLDTWVAKAGRRFVKQLNGALAKGEGAN